MLPSTPVNLRMRRRLIVLALAITGATACAKGSSGDGSAQESAPQAPAPPRFWLVNTKLSAGPGQEAATAIRGPALVELLADGKVRSTPEAKDAFEGFVPEVATKTPADRRGLMLYGQRVAELHLNAPNGPVIGRIHPGAFVSVAPHDESTWLVAVPRYGSEDKPFLAYVERTALGPAPQTQTPPVLPGKVVRDFGLTLWTADMKAFLDRLLCGDFHVTTEDGGRLRATQYYDGIEISGLLDMYAPWDLDDRGENTCLGRRVFRQGEEMREARGRDWLDAVAVEAVPEGYRRVDVPAKDPLATVLERQASVFWLVQTKRGVECHEWKASETRARKQATPPALEGTLRRQRDPIRAHFTLNYTPSLGNGGWGGLDLWGPYFTGGGYKCVRPFYLVGADADRLYVDNPRLREGPPKEWRLFAYHPDDVEHWYLGRDACEAAKARASDALSRDPRATDHLGLHFDCFQELHR